MEIDYGRMWNMLNHHRKNLRLQQRSVWDGRLQ